MSKGRQTLLAIMLGLACIGFLAPRFVISGTRVALTDLACIFSICLLMLGPTKYSQYISGFRKAELFYVSFYLILGLGYSIVYFDPGSLVIAIRVLLFCLAGATVAFLSEVALKRTLMWVTLILLFFYAFDTVNAVVSLVSGKTSLFEFMWNYEGGRLTAPHEGTEGTSSVPIGYLFSFVFLYAFSQYHKVRSISWALISVITISMCVLTASRAAILSVIMIIMVFGYYSNKNSKFLKRVVIMALLFTIIYFLAEILSTKSIINGSLDGSSLQRLNYYSSAFDRFFSEPNSFIFGNGLSDTLLLSRTGIAFYESLLFNSMAQGGIILFISSSALLCSFFYQAYRNKQRILLNQRCNLISIGLIIFIGNMMGGANYFSLYSYLYFCLLYKFLNSRPLPKSLIHAK